jgi:uncharacterized membrane protein SpoIIM required for sporulation
MKLYKSIIKDRKKENIKFEVTRHTIISAILLAMLEMSVFIEVYISSNLLEVCAKFF